MGWNIVAEGNDLTEFEDSQAIDSVPHGTEMRLEIDTYPFPVAPLANLWGMEWVAQKMIGAGARVDEVEGVGWHNIIVHMTAQTPLILIIAAIVAICLSLGYLINKITLLVKSEVIPDIPSWQDAIKWGAIGLAAIVVIAAVVRR